MKWTFSLYVQKNTGFFQELSLKLEKTMKIACISTKRLCALGSSQISNCWSKQMWIFLKHMLLNVTSCLGFKFQLLCIIWLTQYIQNGLYLFLYSAFNDPFFIITWSCASWAKLYVFHTHHKYPIPNSLDCRGGANRRIKGKHCFYKLASDFNLKK